MAVFGKPESPMLARANCTAEPSIEFELVEIIQTALSNMIAKS